VVKMRSGLRLTSGRSHRMELRRALGLPEGERSSVP